MERVLKTSPIPFSPAGLERHVVELNDLLATLQRQVEQLQKASTGALATKAEVADAVTNPPTVVNAQHGVITPWAQQGHYAPQLAQVKKLIAENLGGGDIGVPYFWVELIGTKNGQNLTFTCPIDITYDNNGVPRVGTLHWKAGTFRYSADNPPPPARFTVDGSGYVILGSAPEVNDYLAFDVVWGAS